MTKIRYHDRLVSFSATVRIIQGICIKKYILLYIKAVSRSSESIKKKLLCNNILKNNTHNLHTLQEKTRWSNHINVSKSWSHTVEVSLNEIIMKNNNNEEL